MSDLTINAIEELPQTPLSRGIAQGAITIRRRRFAAMPSWAREFIVGLQLPYTAAAVTLLALISFSFGQYVQNQLYKEAAFFASTFHVDSQLASKEWL